MDQQAIVRELCDDVSTEEMMGALERLQHWVKLSGSTEEMESLRFVEQRIAAYGYRTRILLHDAFISLPGAARVVVEGRDLACITHSFSRPSPAGGLTAPVVYLGAGNDADFTGKDLRGTIVLVDGMATPAVAARGLRAGVAGQIHATQDDHIHEMCISPVWGSPSAETLHELPQAVVCTISRADGAALRDRLQAGEALTATLHAEVDTGWRKTPILVAEMDAPGATGEDAPFVLFSGHHDTWYHGVMDNGAANATMLEVARLAATQHAHWQRGLRFCFWSGHSHGRYSGSAWYADAHWDELERRCVAHVNTDSTGGRGATVLTGSGCAAELRDVARAAIRDVAGQDYTGKRFGRQGDESFWGIGIPSIFNSLSHQAENVGAVHGAVKLGWWWHTPHDTLDKIDPGNLVRDTRVFVHVVWTLLSAERLPFDYTAHARELEGVLNDLAGKLGDRLSLAPLTRALAAFEVAAARTATASLPAATLNAALLRVSRALVPMDYTRGDRFVHDPALAQAPWPVLDPLRRLAAAPAGSAEEAFLRVSAQRAANRVAHALRQAREAFDRLPAA